MVWKMGVYAITRAEPHSWPWAVGLAGSAGSAGCRRDGKGPGRKVMKGRFRWWPGWGSAGTSKKMSEVSMKLSYCRAGYIYPWLKFQVAVLQLLVKSCSPLRPQAHLPLTSLAPRSSLQGGGSGVLGWWKKVVRNSTGGVSLTLPAVFPSALELQLELLLAESVQGASWCQATSASREGRGSAGERANAAWILSQSDEWSFALRQKAQTPEPSLRLSLKQSTQLAQKTLVALLP